MIDTAYIYGLVDPRDGQIHYIGHTIDTAGRLGGHMMDRSDTPKTRWIADVVASDEDVQMIRLAAVPYAERFEQEYKWIYLGRAMSWPLTNTTAMKTEAYTQLMEGLGSTLVVEVDRGLTWHKLGQFTYPLGLLAMAVGAVGQMYLDRSGYTHMGAFIGVVLCFGVAILCAILEKWLKELEAGA